MCGSPLPELLEAVGRPWQPRPCWFVDASFQVAFIFPYVHLSVSIHVSPCKWGISCVELGTIPNTHVNLMTAITQDVFSSQIMFWCASV